MLCGTPTRHGGKTSGTSSRKRLSRPWCGSGRDGRGRSGRERCRGTVKNGLSIALSPFDVHCDRGRYLELVRSCIMAAVACLTSSEGAPSKGPCRTTLMTFWMDARKETRDSSPFSVAAMRMIRRSSPLML
jgi:hypothetical protein